MKVVEEVGELSRSYKESYTEILAKEAEDNPGPRIFRDTALEAIDVITAATSFLERAGYGEKERQELQREVNERNAKRDGGRRFR